MARENFILARRHGNPRFELISGIDVPYQVTRDLFRGLVAESGKLHPEFSQARYYESTPDRTLNFLSTDEDKAIQAQREKDEAAFKSDQEKKAKAEAKAQIARERAEGEAFAKAALEADRKAAEEYRAKVAAAAQAKQAKQ